MGWRATRRILAVATMADDKSRRCCRHFVANLAAEAATGKRCVGHILLRKSLKRERGVRSCAIGAARVADPGLNISSGRLPVQPRVPRMSGDAKQLRRLCISYRKRTWLAGPYLLSETAMEAAFGA